jgi:hypothetical protein
MELVALKERKLQLGLKRMAINTDYAVATKMSGGILSL